MIGQARAVKVHPEIAALQSDPAIRRRVAVTMDRAAEFWKSEPEVAQIASDLEAYSNGAALSECARLNQLMTEHKAASQFVEGFCNAIAAPLQAEPLGEVRFRFKSSSGVAQMQVLRQPQAILSLAAYEPLAHRAGHPASAVFADRTMTEIVVGGSGSGLVHTLGASTQEQNGAVISQTFQWRPGDIITCVPKTQARQILLVNETLLVLQLVHEPASAKPTQEIDLQNGQLIKSASGDKVASEAFMALAVLGALGDMSGLDAMEKAALNPTEDDDVRWEAVRQCLALNADRGLALLDRLAHDQGPLASPARRMRVYLLVSQARA